MRRQHGSFFGQWTSHDVRVTGAINLGCGREPNAIAGGDESQ
jgi:hypothetical protein